MIPGTVVRFIGGHQGTFKVYANVGDVGVVVPHDGYGDQRVGPLVRFDGGKRQRCLVEQLEVAGDLD